MTLTTDPAMNTRLVPPATVTPTPTDAPTPEIAKDKVGTIPPNQLCLPASAVTPIQFNVGKHRAKGGRERPCGNPDHQRKLRGTAMDHKDHIRRGMFIRGANHPVMIRNDATDDALRALDELAAERQALVARMNALSEALANLRRHK